MSDDIDLLAEFEQSLRQPFIFCMTGAPDPKWELTRATLLCLIEEVRRLRALVDGE